MHKHISTHTNTYYEFRPKDIIFRDYLLGKGIENDNYFHSNDFYLDNNKVYLNTYLMTVLLWANSPPTARQMYKFT
jgi:hypothetical protein